MTPDVVETSAIHPQLRVSTITRQRKALHRSLGQGATLGDLHSSWTSNSTAPARR